MSADVLCDTARWFRAKGISRNGSPLRDGGMVRSLAIESGLAAAARLFSILLNRLGDGTPPNLLPPVVSDVMGAAAVMTTSLLDFRELLLLRVSAPVADVDGGSGGG